MFDIFLTLSGRIAMENIRVLFNLQPSWQCNDSGQWHPSHDLNCMKHNKPSIPGWLQMVIARRNITT